MLHVCRRRHVGWLLAFTVLGVTTWARAAEVEGSLVLRSFDRPADHEPVRAAYWTLQNGFKEVRDDRLDAPRELSVVLLGKTHGKPGRVEIAFRGGSLYPSTVVVRHGTTLRIRNEDEIAHELYAVGLESFAPEATSPRAVRTVVMRQTGDWPLRDDLVTHLRGHLHVLADLAAVGELESNGRFRFDDVVPGTYTLKVFHHGEELTARKVEVEDRRVSVKGLRLNAAGDRER